MLTIELMGPKALTYIDYAGWLLSDDGQHHIIETTHAVTLKVAGTDYQTVLRMKDAQTHLSQLVNKHMFVRPEKPDENKRYGETLKSDYEEYKKALHQYENWKPMFKGDWRIHDGGDGKEIQNKSPISGKWRFVAWEGNGRNLEELIRSCEKQGIELFYHPEHEIK